jgi:hypothetical protein
MLFAGLVILFLQRSTMPETPDDRIIHYVPPAVGCAVANWLGNQHQDGFAIVTILAVIVYVLYVLKPFKRES